MKRFLSVWVLCCMPLIVNGTEFSGGADMSKLVTAKEVLADISRFNGTEITLTGTVMKVCKKRGCWMSLKVTEQEEITVKVKDGDMVFPLSAIGKKAYATGVILANKMDLDKTKKYLAHKALENGEAFDASTVKAPITVNILKPSAVTISH
ncbi:DUF4920 domain-containing protein [Pseudoalteromonas aurantia]|uniref:DUF4920 domain-containing protein n=1 Tax=Pseudoalteromonas aurantia TaxID=43654 RepID=A0A5S3VCH5_9GAMM|nr:DUF4920 domain-containing protein [Pseudoalteromonas aurantia]TMO62868.1 DUF4920 domain-containing protein [Pseudoalteromonas aurantia]TMO69615.1 DUF4920 domain-containing protein [Pseudoalteromonas aurantia]TMO75795.1 DUF4920 domain-containing protein [Pseudoalteromonas aurantia]